jgi:hypothetical protein
LPDIYGGTAASISAAAAALTGGSTGKFGSLPSLVVIANTKKKDLFSASCVETECTDFATNKIILANKDNYKDFYVCGFGIMAKIPACPPSTN